MTDELRLPDPPADARAVNYGKLRDLYLNVQDAFTAEIDARDKWTLAHNLWAAGYATPGAKALHTVMEQALTRYTRALNVFVAAEERYMLEKLR